MKNQHLDLLDSLLQQFNLRDPAVGREEAATEPDSETEADKEYQSALTEVEDPELEAYSFTEKKEEGDLGDDKVEPSKITPPKKMRKHTIGDEDVDEAGEEPPVTVLSRKGKEKVESEEDSEDVSADINAELEAAAERVTQTPITK